MQGKKICISSDHAGFPLKEKLITYLKSKGIDPKNLGTDTDQISVDYPDQADKLATYIKENPEYVGILICGSGIGMSIAVNRHPFIRGALVFSEEMATLARRHNDANVLIFGGRFIPYETAKNCTDLFLNTDFEGGRHLKRIQKLQRM